MIHAPRIDIFVRTLSRVPCYRNSIHYLRPVECLTAAIPVTGAKTQLLKRTIA